MNPTTSCIVFANFKQNTYRDQRSGKKCFYEKNENSNVMDFELGTQEKINVPIWIIVGFQQRDRQDSQSLNNDTFYRPPLKSAHCNIGTEKYADGGI